MHKKLTAALTIAIFVLSSVAIFTPASAHFTLGDYKPTFRFHENDFDPHVAGPTGYVWPGSGLSSFTGAPAGFPAGYQTPWPGGKPSGQPSSIYQLEGNAYAPFGAILTSTDDHANRGPLIFAFNYTDPCNAPLGTIVIKGQVKGFFDNSTHTGTYNGTVWGGGKIGNIHGELKNLAAPNVTVVTTTTVNGIDVAQGAGAAFWSFNQTDAVAAGVLDATDLFTANLTLSFNLFNNPGKGFLNGTITLNDTGTQNLKAEMYLLAGTITGTIDSPNTSKCETPKGTSAPNPSHSFGFQPQQALPPITAPGAVLNFTGVTIYIPPEFDLSSASSSPGLIESTFGANAIDFALVQADQNDPIGPGWWILTFEGAIQFWPQHQYKEWYYIRINDAVAPKIAGKYFFKMFLWDSNTDSGSFQMNVPGAWDVHSTQLAGGTVFLPPAGPTGLTFPVENWPVLLVKGEIDPGIVTGTIRYGTFNQTLYGKPINLPGMVDLVGTAIDPYLPDHPSTGRAVEARGYFNASAAGHYEVEGVAPGVYTIYAQAAGYPTMKIAENVVILPGQSFHLDGYLNPGAVVHGQIFSKHLFGEEPWPVNPRPVSVVLYSANDYSPDHIVAWSPWNKTHPPYMAYDWKLGTSAPSPLPVAYPWFTVPPYTLSYYSATVGGKACGGFVDLCGKPDGVGPAQFWWVDAAGAFTNGGGSNSFIFKFGYKGVYGAPTSIDGHVPQPYATWVNGLTAGRYYVRVYLNGYVQTLQDGVTLDESSFEVSQNEWAGDVFLPLDIRVSSLIKKTVHFHDQPGTLDECPINGCDGNIARGQARGNRYLIAEVRDTNGNLMGLNFTKVSASAKSATIEINGFGMIGPDPNTNMLDGGAGMKFSLYRTQGYWDYGLPSGTYVVRTYMRGYLQQTFESVSVTLSGSPALISNHMYRGARFNITVYSIDWEHPRVQRPWEFPGALLRVYVYNEQGRSFNHVSSRGQMASNCNVPFGGDRCVIIEWDGYRTSNTFDILPVTSSHFNYVGWYGDFDPFNWQAGFLWAPTAYYRRGASTNFAAYNALETGTYKFYGFTYGYLQHKEYSVYVMKGGFADIKLNLLQGVNLTINIPFKKEGIYAPTEFNMSMRVRVFDDQGRLIGDMQSKFADSLLYDTGSPFGIGRSQNYPGGSGAIFADAGFYTYYSDPLAKSPNKVNGITSMDSGPNTADGFLWYGTWNGVTGWQAYDSDLNGDGNPDFSYANWQYGYYQTWIPAGTKQVRVFIAGIYDYNDPLNALYAGVLKGRKLDGIRDAYPYGIPGSSSTIPEGIPVSYSGKYYVEVDTWNEYPAPTFTGGVPDATNWYPPVKEGLLQGDSFHTIPGASPDVFGYTGNTLAANGLGPYAQRMVWEVPNGHLGSEVSVVYELDKRGFISGNIYGFTWSDELRTVSWANVVFSSAAGNLTFSDAYSWDSFYGSYLDAGQYEMSVIAWSPAGQGYTVVKAPVTISTGQSTTGVTFQLERSNIPIPEISGLAIVLVSALAASLYILRRRRR